MSPAKHSTDAAVANRIWAPASESTLHAEALLAAAAQAMREAPEFSQLMTANLKSKRGQGTQLHSLGCRFPGIAPITGISL